MTETLLRGIEALEDYAVVVLDPEGRVASWNRGAERVFGYAAREMVGQPLDRLYPAEEAQLGRAARDLGEAARAGKLEEKGWRLRKDGSRFWTSVVLSAVAETDGRRCGYLVVTRDLEEHAAQAASEASLRAMLFLAQASATLGSTLDHESTLQGVARLVVPFLADNCVVDLLDDDGTIRRVAEAAADPAKEPILRELRRFPPNPARRSPVLEVLRTGESVFIPTFDSAALERISSGDEYREIVRRIAPRSSVTVPLAARGRVLGAITFGMAESGRSYTRADLQLAEELGRRAGVAIDNALLFKAHKEARAAAAASERRFSSMFESAPFAICLVRLPSTAIADVNPAFVRLFGFTREECIGKTSLELGMHVEPEGRERVRAELAWCGFVRNMETRVATKDGRALVVSNNLDLVEIDGEQYVLGTYLDITEQRHAEKALRDSERHFRFLADNLPQIIWTANAAGETDYYNERWYEFTGFERGRSGDESWRQIVHPDDLEMCIETWSRSVRTGDPYQIEYRFKDRRTGGYRWFLGRAVPLRDDEGRVTRWFGTCTDIQAQKETAERIGEALRVREDFLAIAGHELKTPLAALLMHVQSLHRAVRGGTPAINVLSRLDKAANAGFRLEALINQMLDVSRIAAGRLRLEPERVELDALVREVIDRFAESAARAGSPITKRIEPRVRGAWDRLRIEQVLSNLIANAIKYGKGKPIEVSLVTEAATAVLRVTDRGIGIDPSAQDRIFERFERAVGAREFGGFGLGLWISRQIVEGSGGRIEVESMPGQGSTFTVRLPLGPSGDQRAVS